MIVDQIDYKGKWFILQDKNTPDEFGMDYSIGEMDTEDMSDDFLEEHVDACLYYGIPAYIGIDAKLLERVETLYKKLNNEYEE